MQIASVSTGNAFGFLSHPSSLPASLSSSVQTPPGVAVAVRSLPPACTAIDATGRRDAPEMQRAERPGASSRQEPAPQTGTCTRLASPKGLLSKHGDRAPAAPERVPAVCPWSFTGLRGVLGACCDPQRREGTQMKPRGQELTRNKIQFRDFEAGLQPPSALKDTREQTHSRLSSCLLGVSPSSAQSQG